jgi:16S rRNA (guanine527-N7)-methyltransferase
MPALDETSGVAAEAPPRQDMWPGLHDAALAIGVSLEPGTIERLARYRDILLDWNTRFNLTAIAEPEAVDRVLLLDAVRMLPSLDRATAATGIAHPSLIDIGSGGGLPGVPIAICRPAIDVTMVEATGKKVRFLEAVIEELGLRNARAIAARAEELGRDPAERARYDLATARAVSSLPALVELVLPFLRVGGVGLFPKGLDIESEIASSPVALDAVGGTLAGDELLQGGTTRLVTIRKIRPTPERFPRRAGLPSRQPLGGSLGSNQS